MTISLLLVAACLQAGGPPQTGPGGQRLLILDSAERQGTTLALGCEQIDPLDKDFYVYEATPQGDMVLVRSVEPQTPVKEGLAIEGQLIVARDTLDQVRVYNELLFGWSDGALLRANPVPGLFSGAIKADIRDGLVALGTDADGATGITVHNIRIPGVASLVATFDVGGNRRVRALALGDGRLVAVVAEDDGQFAVQDVEVILYEALPVGWTSGVTLDPPPGVDWSNQHLSVDVDSGRVVIAVPQGPVTDPCGRVYEYAPTAAGSYVVVNEIRSRRQCLISPQLGGAVHDVTLRSQDLVFATSPDWAGERFVRSGVGWAEAEMVRLDGGYIGPYGFAGDFLYGSGGGGVQTFERQDVAEGLEIVCPSLNEAPISRLTAIMNRTLAPALVFLEWQVEWLQAAGPAYMVIGFRDGLRPLSQESQLCIGGPIRLASVTILPSPLGFSGIYLFDPVLSGITPGSTVYFQGWRREPGLTAGRTSNAIAVTFAP